jgi:hypothetical protein
LEKEKLVESEECYINRNLAIYTACLLFCSNDEVAAALMPEKKIFTRNFESWEPFGELPLEDEAHGSAVVTLDIREN